MAMSDLDFQDSCFTCFNSTKKCDTDGSGAGVGRGPTVGGGDGAEYRGLVSLCAT
jgi:hypothetical protein